MSENYRICIHCVMDTSDPDIKFDEEGVCNYCRAFEERGKGIVERAASEEGSRQLDTLVARLKSAGKGKEYDCLVGVSGGVDSSYVAYQTKRLGLRPLAVHFDSGWNSELAVSNIENLIKKLNIDLYTYVVDWDEMSDLQLAFFMASVANCDIPTDHAFLTVLYRVAAEHGIRYILSGYNTATEFILPKSWGYNAADTRHIKSIHAQFGKTRLRKYPFLPFVKRYIYYPFFRRIQAIPLLDYMTYNKAEAKKIITEELNWRDYGVKHGESVFTRFFQSYYLPKKFGYDKRRAHLSSLIVSGQMTRNEAMAELARPVFTDAEMQADKEFVAKKLGISIEEFDAILARPHKTYKDYSSNECLFKLKDRVVEVLPNLRYSVTGRFDSK